MPETPKPENEKNKTVKRIVEDLPEIGEESTWSKDQTERNYYYDDAYGYEKYVDEDDAENEENSDKESS